MFDLKKDVSNRDLTHHASDRLSQKDKPPLDIVIVFSDLNSGGAQIQVLNLINSIKNQQFNFIVCCLKGRGRMVERFEKDGHKVICLDMKSRFSAHRIVTLYRLLKRLDVLAVLTQGGGDALFWGRLAAYTAGVDTILSTIHTTGRTPDGKAPVHKLNKYLSFTNKYYICVCEYQAAYYNKVYGFKNDQIKVIYNGVKISKIDNETKTRLSKNLLISGKFKKIVGIVAALEKYKNHIMLLKAISEIVKIRQDILFLIIGEGQCRKEIEFQVKKLAIHDNIKFMGYIENTIEYMSVMDVIVLTSKTTETFPVCLLEAMSQAKPIVATRVGGVPEMVVDGETGFLVDIDDYQAFAENILKILTIPDLQEKMGDNALSLCKNKFDINSKADELMSLILEA